MNTDGERTMQGQQPVLPITPGRRGLPPGAEPGPPAAVRGYAAGGPGGVDQPPASPAPAGDPTDLASYIEPIYRFVYARIGVREDAEDVTSQVFLKAVRRADLARDEASVRSWLYQVARTCIADFWRERYRHDAQTVRLDPEIAAGLADAAGAVADDADPAPPLGEQTKAESTVRDILAQLPENYQRVLTLRFLEGLPIKAVAAEMRISEGNVKVLQYRALQKAARIGGGSWR